MLIKEAMGVFWQTFKDTWEELYSIAMINLVWLFAWAIPVGLASATGLPAVIIPASLLSLGAFAVTTAGVYYATNRVAHGKTFHFSDFIEGIKLYWWRSLIWLVATAVVAYLAYLNLVFYPSTFEGNWVIFVSGFWIAVIAFWLVMQLYFWPLLIEQENPKMLLAWRNCAYLIFANPFYAFFMVSFTIVILTLSIAIVILFIFVGMGIVGILGNNAVLTLLAKFGIIEDPRPKPLR